MGLFGKSLQKSVDEALVKVRGQFPRASISATVNDKVVTLSGDAPDLDTKTKIMVAFNSLVEADNTINKISIPKPATATAPAAAKPAAAAPAGPQIHQVVKGDTLSAIAKRYYGNASKYPRIFEANRDILDDPDKIKVGQKLKIPV